MSRSYRSSSAPAVVFSGMIAGTPDHGGATWAVLNHLLGLREAGCRVTFVEPVEDAGRHEAVARAASALDGIGMRGRWCLVDATGGVAGMDRAQLRLAADDADLLINVSGMLSDVDVLERIERRVYLDLDPGFVQMWHDAGVDMRLDAHTHFASLSDTIGSRGSPIPDCARTWIGTLPPVALDQWTPIERTEHEAFTTVANWRSYGSVRHRDRDYGQKAHFVRSIAELPGRSPDRFLLALGIDDGDSADRRALHASGWEVLDPRRVSATPEAYRAFIRGSRAEIGIAKHGYVATGCGWFSDRSACYLAAGRPVIAAATGFARRLPVGSGLFEFDGVESFLVAADVIRGDIDGQRQAARAVAREHLAAAAVMSRLLERIG